MHNTEVRKCISCIGSCGCDIVCIRPALPVSESPSGIYFYRSNNCVPRKVIVLYRSPFCTHFHTGRISIGNWYQLPMLIPWVPEWEQRREVLRGIIYPVSPRWQRGKRALRRWLQTQVPRICTESITNGPVLICPFPSFSRPYTLIK